MKLATVCADDEKANVLDVIRGKTWHKWHKTVVSNNTMPTLTDICLHGKIIACTIKLNASATSPEINKVDLTKNAYEEQTVLVPEWDTLHNVAVRNHVALQEPAVVAITALFPMYESLNM